MEKISDRLRRLMAERGTSQYRLWKDSGVSQPTIKRILDGESKEPDKSTVSKLAVALGCSYEWLYDGDGLMVEDEWSAFGNNMKRLASQKNSVSEVAGGYALEGMAAWDDATPLDADDVEIPLFKEVEMAAGDGATHSIEINGRKLRFSKATLKAAGVDIANAACATVTGNSMERMISDGATIGVDRGRTQIRDGEIYAIDHDGMLRVKYLYRMPGGGLRLRSENSSEHPDEILTQEQAQRIRVLGWVFWWSTLRTWGGR